VQRLRVLIVLAGHGVLVRANSTREVSVRIVRR
jgi:hypothetical protein